MRVHFLDEASAELDEATDWYIAQEALSAAADLHSELSRAVGRLAAEPGLGTPGLRGTRTFPIHRFPYSLVYRVDEDVLTVVSVSAHRRRPEYWARRL